MSNFDNRIALWKNDDRQKETSPNLKGEGLIDGVEYWASAWTSNEGGKKPVVSISVKRKDTQKAKNPERAKGSAADFDDDLPF